MSKGSAPPKVARSQVAPSVVARRSALGGGSLLAIGRALMSRALPGAIIGIGLFSLPENALNAIVDRNAASAPQARANIGTSVLPRLGLKRLNAAVPKEWRREALPEPRVIADSHRVASAIERAVEGRSSFETRRLGADQRPVDLAGTFQSDGFGVAQNTSVSGSTIGGAPCAGEMGPICEMLSAPPPAVPMPRSFGGRPELALGGREAYPLSEPAIKYLPVALDVDVAAPPVTIASGQGPAETLAEAVAAQSSVLQELEPDALGPEIPPTPAQKAPPYVPETPAVPPSAALRSRDLGEAEVSVLATASAGISRVQERPASDIGDTVRLGIEGHPALSGDAGQRPLSEPVAILNATTKGAALGSMNPLPISIASATRETQELAGAVIELTGRNGWQVASAFSVPRLVQLRSLITAFSDRFDAPELQRMTASRAADVFVPVEMLEKAGIVLDDELVGIAPLSKPMMSSQEIVQLQSTRGGSVGGRAGLGDLGLKHSLTASASAGFDRNPFLSPLASPEAVSLRLQLAPALSRSGERSSFRLSGRLEHIEYLGTYDSLQNYGADVAVSRKLTERLEVDGGLSFRSDIRATNLGNPIGIDDTGTDNPVPPLDNDVTIFGQRQRSTQYGLNAGLTYDPSERDELRWTVSARADRFGSEDLVESNFLAQRFQYSRRLGEDITIGAAIDANLIDFTGTGLEGAQTVSPQLQVKLALTPRLAAQASFGLSVTRLQFNGLEDTTTAAAGNASLCRKDERSNFCINGSRQVLPAAIGGALLQSTAGFSYSLRLSERDTVQLRGSYATASQPIATAVDDFESINGSARYERQLNERMRLYVSGGVLDTTGNQATSFTNIQGLIGITMSFGHAR